MHGIEPTSPPTIPVADGHSIALPPVQATCLDRWTILPHLRGFSLVVPEGLNKPYMDLEWRVWVWVKNGADKRHFTAREEMQAHVPDQKLI